MEENDILKKICDQIRGDDNRKADFSNDQIIVLDLINMIYTLIAYKHFIQKRGNEKSIRGLLMIAFAEFFGNDISVWLDHVTEKMNAAIKERQKGNAKLNEITVEEIVSTIRISEVEMIKQLHERYNIEMPQFEIKRSKRRDRKRGDPYGS